MKDLRVYDKLQSIPKNGLRILRQIRGTSCMPSTWSYAHCPKAIAQWENMCLSWWEKVARVEAFSRRRTWRAAAQGGETDLHGATVA